MSLSSFNGVRLFLNLPVSIDYTEDEAMVFLREEDFTAQLLITIVEGVMALNPPSLVNTNGQYHTQSKIKKVSGEYLLGSQVVDDQNLLHRVSLVYKRETELTGSVFTVITSNTDLIFKIEDLTADEISAVAPFAPQTELISPYPSNALFEFRRQLLRSLDVILR